MTELRGDAARINRTAVDSVDIIQGGQQMNGMRIILFALLILHLFPFAATQFLILKYPFAGQKNGKLFMWSCTGLNVLLNSFVLYEIAAHLNLTEIVHVTCSYQDISRLATSNVISLSIAVLIGRVLYACACRYYQDEPDSRFSSKCLLLLSLAAVPILLGYYDSYSGSYNLAINEICRKTTVIGAGNAGDDEVCYVSVINKGVLTYELDQLYLSDDLDELQERLFFQEVNIKPGEEYQFNMASGDSLDIKKNGGSIVYLSDKFGNVVDELEVPALKRNESYKKMGTGWQIVNLAEGRENFTVSAPSFSRESGFYDGPFELELSADPGTTIYYTLDSSNPTTRSTKYSQPVSVYDRSEEDNRYRSIRNVQDNYLNLSFNGDVPVDKCFVVRAVAVDRDGNYSDVITKSYFINQDKYRGGTVISLVSEPDGLFGDNGIYVTGKEYDERYLDAYAKKDENGNINLSNMPTANYYKRGIEWERESNLEVFKKAELLLSQPVGIRIQGNSTRNGANKRFSIYAREEYSSSDYFDVDLLNNYSQHSLYTRGGDLHALSQMLGQGRDVATTDFIAVDVFLDGEFWYTTYLFEKFNEKNFAQKYGLFTYNVMIAKYKNALDSENTYEFEAGKNPLSSLIDFIGNHDLSDDENYLKYNEILDVQSYIDWCCINSFLQNMDYSEQHNNLFWHTVVSENGQEGDARWRLGLYDMDLYWSDLRYMGYDDPYYEANPFTTSWHGVNPHYQWPIYSALMRNDLFCKQFVLTFMDLINTNFSVENTMALMERLGITNTGYREFFEKRPGCIIPYMAEEFELTGTQENVTISSNVSGTPVTLNTISPELKQSNGTFLWAGSYYTDYPVTVTANAPAFSRWEVTAGGRVQTFTDKTIEIPVPEGGVQIHAVFK